MAAVSQSLARSEQKDDGLFGSFEGTSPSITQTTPQDPIAMMAQAMAALLASSNDDKFFWREHQMAEERRRREEADIRITTEVRYRQEEEERRRREEEVQIKWVEVERERQIRMEKLEELSAQRGNSAIEEQARIMESKEALCKAEQLDRKRSNILHNLQKLNDSTDPEAYIETFEAAMTDGSFDQKDWLPALRNLLTGKALSFFRELAVTEETLYLSFKTSFLERMGCTIKQARKTLWNNHPENDTNLREHLQPILRAITRLGEHLTTKADFTAELFQGCLSAYYSPDAIYNLRHSDPKDSFVSDGGGTTSHVGIEADMGA